MSDPTDSGAPWHILATRAEVLRLVERIAAERAREVDSHDIFLQEEDVIDRFFAASARGVAAVEAACVFAVTAAGLLRDASLVGPVLEVVRPLLAEEVDDARHLADGLALLFALCDDVEVLAAWARERPEWVSLGLAGGLRPAREEQRALLRRLARDPRQYVRIHARDRLRRVEAVPRWWGCWPDDPAALAGGDLAAAHAELIAAWEDHLDATYSHTASGDDRAMEALRAMPDALAVPAIVMALRGSDYLDPRAKLTLALLAREGGAEAAVREAAEHPTALLYVPTHLAEALAAAPMEQRDALATAALAALRATPEEHWQERRPEIGCVARLLAAAWDEGSHRALVEPALARRLARGSTLYGVERIWPKEPEPAAERPPPTEAERAARAEWTAARIAELAARRRNPTPWDERAPLFDLLPREQVEALLARGAALLESGYGWREGEGERHRRAQLEWPAGFAAAVFGMHAASVLRDPALLPDVMGVCGGIDGRYKHAAFRDALSSALATLVPLAEPGAGVLDPLLQQDQPRARHAVIEWLRPEREVDRAVLETLSGDAVLWVREAAQKRLAEVAEVAWWRGHFARDPTSALDADEARRLQPTFEALVALMNDPAVHDAPGDQLTPHLAALPDEVMVALAEHHLRPGDSYFCESWKLAVARGAVGRPGAAAMFLRVAEQWDEADEAYHLGSLEATLQKGDPAWRRELCDALLRRFADARGAPWTDVEQVEHFLLGWLRVCWGHRWDVAPLFDLLVRQVAQETSHRTDARLEGIIAWAQQGSAALVAPAARALEEGCTGRWTRLHDLARTLVKRLPWDDQRALAERVLLADGGGVEWALGELLGPLFDEERDGPHGERVATLLDDPRWRAAIVGSSKVRPLALAVLRAELRAGTLDVESAAGVLADINARFDRPTPVSAPASDTEDEDAEDEDAEDEDAEDEDADVMEDDDASEGENDEGEGDEGDDGEGDDAEEDTEEEDAEEEFPAALSGPITEEEWGVWRRVRDAAIEAKAWRSGSWLGPLLVLPKGTLRPEDEPALTFALDRLRVDQDRADEIALIHAVEGHACERALEVVDAVLAAAPRRWSNHRARFVRYKMRVELGLDPRVGEPPPTDDDDDDDGDDDE